MVSLEDSFYVDEVNRNDTSKKRFPARLSSRGYIHEYGLKKMIYF